ncbi:hypothetical protein D3C76_1286300 [compost metagenome]
MSESTRVIGSAQVNVLRVPWDLSHKEGSGRSPRSHASFRPDSPATFRRLKCAEFAQILNFYDVSLDVQSI